MNADSIKTYFSDVTLACRMPSINENGHLFEFDNKWTNLIETFNTTSILSNCQHYLLHVRSVSKKTSKAFILCNLIQEELKKDELASISRLLMPVRIIKSNTGSATKKIGSINYNNLPDVFKQKNTRQMCDYYFLNEGFYLLIPLASNNKKKFTNLNYLMQIFSNEDIFVEEVLFNNEFKFLTVDEKYINIIGRKCNFCEQLIEGAYTHNDNYVYHSQCYDSMNLCDFCLKKIEKSFYPMNQSLKCCTTCYEQIQERVNSAKKK